MGCDICKGAQVIYKDNIPYKCVCLTAKEILNYLGNYYKDALFTENKETLSKLEKNKFMYFSLIDSKCTWNEAKKRIKSYLIHTIKTKKISHYTLTPTELITITITNGELRSIIDDTDFVILYIDSDTPNSYYKEYIPQFLKHRHLNNKRTWIYSIHGLENRDFRSKYGVETITTIKELFAIPSIK